jgi:hypothetical protein
VETETINDAQYRLSYQRLSCKIFPCGLQLHVSNAVLTFEHSLKSGTRQSSSFSTSLWKETLQTAIFIHCMERRFFQLLPLFITFRGDFLAFIHSI